MTAHSRQSHRARQLAAGFVIAVAASTAAPAAPALRRNPDTTAWWALTGELSGDAREGRDTGSPGYDAAAAIVARRFAAAGLAPAGEGGTFMQPIAFDDIRVETAGTRLTLSGRPLALDRAVLLQPDPATPAWLDVPATFRGTCGPDAIADVAGRLVVCTGSPPPPPLAAFDRAAALRRAGAAGMLLVAAPGLASEPIRWPFAYSRSVAPLGTRPPARSPFLVGRLNPAVVPALARATTPRDLGRFTATLALSRRTTRSANVLGLLPGTDPALANEVVIVSAHLDGYGRGTPVGGDAIYNGALDDAAYVALLERLAERRHGRGFRRPVLFAVFTGEEKGLLGSRWFVSHPTLGARKPAANINLDQVRPLYPLKLMTVHGLVETTLGDEVRAVATRQHIRVQEDPDPERHLVSRGDNWPFMRASVPSTSFVFATYDARSLARYRDWYQRRYHHPADDLSTPIDWQAAAEFNRFFYDLTEAVADAADKPAWKAGHNPPTSD